MCIRTFRYISLQLLQLIFATLTSDSPVYTFDLFFITLQFQDDHENDNQESASDMFGNIFIDPNEEKYLHLDDNLFDDLSLFDDLPSSVYIVSLDDLEQYIQNLQRNKNILQASLEQNYIEVYKIDNEIQFVENTMEYVKVSF